jgi:TRAP-type C4-dicarboxylate transport system substrate-binding protein
MAAPEMILVNTGVWNSFSEEEKRIVKEGALEGARVQRAAWLAAEREFEARARAAGSIIYVPTPEELQLFRNALEPLYDQPAYAAFADVVRRIRAVQ